MNTNKIKKDKAQGRRDTAFDPETTAGDDFFNQSRDTANSVASSRKNTVAESMNLGGDSVFEKKIAHETET